MIILGSREDLGDARLHDIFNEVGGLAGRTRWIGGPSDFSEELFDKVVALDPNVIVLVGPWAWAHSPSPAGWVPDPVKAISTLNLYSMAEVDSDPGLWEDMVKLMTAAVGVAGHLTENA